MFSSPPFHLNQFGQRFAATLALLLLGALAAIWAVRALLVPAAEPVPAVAPVPEHQRSGPMANPWGSGVPVTSTRAEDTAAAASAAELVSAAASASVSSFASAAGAGASARAASAAPPSSEALRQALARLRAGPRAGEFVSTALQGGDKAAMVAAWMVERQCRQATQWRQITEWRARAGAVRPAAAAASPAFADAAQCQPMPDAGAIEAALEAAGFPTTTEQTTEMTRRPLDLALAVAVGDPLLLAEVLEATPPERVALQLQAWGADARDLSPEAQRAALWWASCMAPQARAAGATSGALLPACREHPALWQACAFQGLCDVRDLRDMLLRSLPADALSASERLARWLAPRIGR